jgi:hypothetical protein
MAQPVLGAIVIALEMFVGKSCDSLAKKFSAALCGICATPQRDGLIAREEIGRQGNATGEERRGRYGRKRPPTARRLQGAAI